MSDTVDFEVINKFTGEVFTVSVDSNKLDSLVGALLQVQEQRKALDELESFLKEILAEDHLAKNDYQPIASSLGYDVKYVQGGRKNYDASVVVSHMDLDLLISKGALVVSNAKLEGLMADLVRKQEFAHEDSRAILDSVVVKQTKPYVKLEKAKH